MRFEYFTKYIVIIKKQFSPKLLLVTLFILIFYSCIVVFKLQLSVNLNFLNVKVYNSDSSLPAVVTTLSPQENRIFFHETSGKGRLNSRQGCSVESAAKTHPKWQINILFLGSYLDENIDLRCINALKMYPNINFFGLDIKEYSTGTPLESMIRNGKLNKSRWQVSHTSDALRYLSLYKWGGVYLDLDMIVAKPFEDLAKNWGARESKTAVAAGAIAFSTDQLGREIAEAAILDFKVNFRGNIWGHNGPGVMTRVLEKLCNVTIANMSATQCKGFEVYGPELFYPISWRRAKNYFSSQKLALGQPYTYHTWNRLTEKYKVENTSLYAQLAKKYCPEIYNAYEGDFGV